MGQVAAQLANLRPPWDSASSPKEGRPPNHGLSIIEWLNRLGTMPEGKVRAIAVDPAAPIAKRKAAKSHLRSLSDEYAKNGRPFAADDLDRQLDRTVGKPLQQVQVTRTEVADPAALRVQLLSALARNPALLSSLGVSVAGVLGEGADDGVGAPKEA